MSGRDGGQGTGLLAEAEALYALPLGGFTPARDARAKALKAEDAALARAVKALRKPTVAAWVVDLLVRRESAQVGEVLALGAALREAQEGLAGEELRALTRQRRQLTAALTTRARALARQAGQPVTAAVADQVEATLTAAILDEGAAAAVRSGMLVAPLAATGVDAVDATAAVAVPEALGHQARPVDDADDDVDGEVDGDRPGGAPDLRLVPDPEAAAKARAAAAQAVAEAQQVVDEAEDELAGVRGSLQELAARELELEGRLDELRRQVAELEDEADQVADEVGDLEELVADAQAALDDATAERDAAQAALDALG